MFQKVEEYKFRNAKEALEAMKYANELLSQAIAYLSNTGVGVSMPSMKAVGKPLEVSMKDADMAVGRLFRGYGNNDQYYADAAKDQNIKNVDGHYVMAKKYSFGQLPVGEASRVYDRIVTDHTRVT